MKFKNYFSITVLCFLAVYSKSLNAQSQQVSITQIHQKDSIVEISITSPEHFYVGSRPYALHLGEKIFLRSQQFDEESYSMLTFYIPASEFRQLTDGTEAILVYGYFNHTPQINAERDNKNAAFPGKQWKLGLLQKEMLTR